MAESQDNNEKKDIVPVVARKEELPAKAIAYSALLIAVLAITIAAILVWDLRTIDGKFVKNNATTFLKTTDYVQDQSARSLSVKYTISDLWLKDLSLSAQKNVNTFESNNHDYYTCVYNNKPLEDIGLVRNLWPEEDNAAPAKYLVLQYDNHFLTYSQNGSVTCYSNPLSANKTSAPCNSFCNTTVKP